MSAALVCYRLQSGKIADARVGVGGAEPFPRRIAAAEAALNGQAPGDKVFRAAAEAAANAVEAMEDHQTTAEYRRDLVRAVVRRALEMAARMTAHTKGSGLKWVGRAIRRLEDPALVQGQGRFTHDLPAAHWVRFVRSPVAAGTINKIETPKGAMVVTAADLKGVKPILPMLHKFAYKPVGQQVLAETQVRFVGEPVAAAVAASEEEAEDIADQVALDIAETPPVIDASAALRPGAPQVHREAPGNVILEGQFKTDGFDAAWSGAHKVVKIEARSYRQNATPMETRGGHAVLRCRDRPRHVDLHDADAALDPHRHRRRARHAGERSARDRARCRRRLRAENVARRRIRRAGVAGTQAQKLGRLDRGPARKFDRRFPCARSNHHVGRRLRQETQS